MPFGHVPVARVGAVLSEWRRVSLTGRYTYTWVFYRETEVVSVSETRTRQNIPSIDTVLLLHCELLRLEIVFQFLGVSVSRVLSRN